MWESLTTLSIDARLHQKCSIQSKKGPNGVHVWKKMINHKRKGKRSREKTQEPKFDGLNIIQIEHRDGVVHLKIIYSNYKGGN
jgi:hypothetical protein